MVVWSTFCRNCVCVWYNSSLRSSFFFFFFFGTSTGVWTQGLLGKHELELFHLPFFCVGYFQDRVSQTTCLSWLWTLIFLISASRVTRIADVSHQVPSQILSDSFPDIRGGCAYVINNRILLVSILFLYIIQLIEIHQSGRSVLYNYTSELLKCLCDSCKS
jgi:hypothetical protein